jgi:PhoH-like ATPase
MLSVKTGLYQVVAKEHYKNLLFIRNPIVADNTDIGFLPGDKSEKIHDFCRPFLQYVENEKDQFYAENLIKNEKIKMDVVSFLKGISIDDSFVIMDEAEDLNTKLIKLVGSRIGEKSCIVFTGDWKQSENKYKNDNGLLRLIESSKGNPLVGIVVLEEDVRSSASKLFAEL